MQAARLNNTMRHEGNAHSLFSDNVATLNLIIGDPRRDKSYIFIKSRAGKISSD